MKLGFRQFIYAVILVFAISLCVTECSRQILVPYFNKETISESRILYQKTQEERVKNNIDSVLQKLLGKETFQVSVDMNFKEDYVQQDVVKRDPQNASEKFSEETSKEFQHLKADAMDDRPSSALMKHAVEEQNGKLPGMIDLSSKSAVSDPLPGFPVLPEPDTKSAVSTKDAPTLEDIAKPVSSPDMNPDEKDSNSYKKKSEQSRVYYNETVTHTTHPGNKVEKMFVNVVVDSDQMRLLDITKDDLEKLISDVASIDPKRGDELNVSYFPFMEKSFGVQQFYAKNRKMLTFMAHVLDKLRWVIVGLFVVLVLAGLAFLFYKMARKKMADSQRLMEEEKAKRLEEEKHREKEKLDVMEEKRKAVVNLAQAKPDDIATLILNWIEAFEGEEGKKNVPSSEQH